MLRVYWSGLCHGVFGRLALFVFVSVSKFSYINYISSFGEKFMLTVPVPIPILRLLLHLLM